MYITCLASGTDGGQENLPSFCNDHGQYATSGSRFLVHKMMFLGVFFQDGSLKKKAGFDTCKSEKIK